MAHSRYRVLPLLSLAVLHCLAQSPGALPLGSLPLDSSSILTPGEALDAVLMPARPKAEPWNPKASPVQKTRGIAGSVFPKAAPAVVVVRTSSGHGSGCIIDPKGWVLTNHHVIADAALDPVTGARMATIHLGRMGPDRSMKIIEPGFKALVLKSDEAKDLALLRLVKLPTGAGPLPFIKLAKVPPRPGMDTVSIGHPSAAFLWTSRSCEVTGIGDWPRDHMDFAMQRLMASGSSKVELEAAMKTIPQRHVAMTSCGINPGDSGGPLLNGQGELVAVTFGVPRGDTQGVSYDKFALHVHIDEVRAFLADIPAQPGVPSLNPWPTGGKATFVDLDHAGRMDALLIGPEGGDQISGVMIDARHRSASDLTLQDLRSQTGRRKFKFDFSFIGGANARAFYDTDGDGVIDLVLEEPRSGDHPTCALKLGKDGWHVVPVTAYPNLIDPNLIPPEGRDRFLRVLAGLKKP